MRLEDWFASLRDQRLSEKDKALMYARILDKTHTSILTKRLQFYAKVGTLSVLIFGIGIYLLGTIGNKQRIQDSTLPVVTLDSNIGNIVQADTIGRLINIQGSIAVFAGDEEVDSDTIVSGNRVALQEGARVELVVRQGVKAIITGPAIFSMERMQDDMGASTVVLNLIEGSYFELVPVQTAEKEQLALEDHVDESFVVKTSDFEIQQLPAQRDIHVTITKDESGNATLTNQGSDLIVKRLSDKKEQFTVVGQDETTIIETETLEKQLTDTQLTIRYETETAIIPLPATEVSLEETEQEKTKETKETKESTQDILTDTTDTIVTPLENKQRGSDNTGTASPVSPGKDAETEKVMLTSNKRVLEKSTMDSLQSTLVVSFAQKHLRDIALYRATGETGKSQVAIATLSSMVNRARSLVGLGAVSGDLVSVKQGIVGLKNTLLDQYYISPSFIARLDTLITKISVVTSIPEGILSDHPDSGNYENVMDLLRSKGFSL